LLLPEPLVDALLHRRAGPCPGGRAARARAPLRAAAGVPSAADLRHRVHEAIERLFGHRLRALDQQDEQIANRLMTELESTLEEIRTSERSVILLDEELVTRAVQVLTILSEEYATGNARFDELLQIQRELLDLELERIEAIAKQNRAVAKIESLIGDNPLLRGDR
jgi:Arc/MetJ family transcription regulator